jgi:hypothetical protein
MYGDGALTFREFAMREPLPLATIHDAVLEFLRGVDDAVLVGAQAVNAYVDEPRMTQEVDIASPRAAELAEQIREHLAERFQIAVRVEEVAQGRGFRIYQVQKPKNRHLVDLRPVPAVPPARRVEGVLVLTPEELIASKVIASHRRRDKPKYFSDRRDLAVMLLAFPHLKTSHGPVRDCLEASGAGESVLAAWDDVVLQEIRPEEEDEDM